MNLGVGRRDWKKGWRHFDAERLVFWGPKRSLRVQADVRNLTDRLNVINFAGLFSGTRACRSEEQCRANSR